MITVVAGQPIAQSSGCCPCLCLWQLNSSLTGECRSVTVRDFVKRAADQNAPTAPAEVSQLPLTTALLAPPMTWELRNERRGGAFIYITNVRVRRTWAPLAFPCLVSLSDQTGGCIIHQTASKWRKDIHHCPPIKLDPTDVAISQTHQYSGPAEGSYAETSLPLQLYQPFFSETALNDIICTLNTCFSTTLNPTPVCRWSMSIQWVYRFMDMSVGKRQQDFQESVYVSQVQLFIFVWACPSRHRKVTIMFKHFSVFSH